MGGLIVKEMLVSNPKLFENTRLIVFLSTPHLGSEVAKTVTKFSFAIYPSSEIYQLSTDSNYLVDLNKKFLRLVNGMANKFGDKPIRLLSICENLPTHLAFNVYAKTVTELSANIGVGEFILANHKDHLNICKAEDRNCFVYTKINQEINKILNEKEQELMRDAEYSNNFYRDYLFWFFKLVE